MKEPRHTDCWNLCYFKNKRYISCSFSSVFIHMTDLRERQDQEGPASTGFHDDRQELGVDGAEGAVPRHLGHTDVIVRLLGLDRLAEDVAELALPHDAATHG